MEMDEFSFPAVVDPDTDHGHGRQLPFPESTSAPDALWFHSPETSTTRLWRSFSEHGPFTAASPSPRRITAAGLRSPALSDICSEEERMDVLWEDLNDNEERRHRHSDPRTSDGPAALVKLRKQREAAAAEQFDGVPPSQLDVVVAVKRMARGRWMRPGLASMLRTLKRLFVARKGNKLFVVSLDRTACYQQG